MICKFALCISRTICEDNTTVKLFWIFLHQKSLYIITMTSKWARWRLKSPASCEPHDCLLNVYSRCRSKKTSKLRVTGLCAGNSPVTGEFPAQMVSNAENVYIWWLHHVTLHGAAIVHMHYIFCLRAAHNPDHIWPQLLDTQLHLKWCQTSSIFWKYCCVRVRNIFWF